MTDINIEEMNQDDAVRWLKSLKDDIGSHSNASLWHYEQALLEIIHMIEKQPKWIPVEERLPEKDGSYIGYVVAEGKRYVIQVFFISGKWSANMNTLIHVTHWMPLPKRLKEGEA